MQLLFQAVVPAVCSDIWNVSVCQTDLFIVLESNRYSIKPLKHEIIVVTILKTGLLPLRNILYVSVVIGFVLFT